MIRSKLIALPIPSCLLFFACIMALFAYTSTPAPSERYPDLQDEVEAQLAVNQARSAPSNKTEKPHKHT